MKLALWFLSLPALASTIYVGAAFEEVSLSVGPYIRTIPGYETPRPDGSIATELLSAPCGSALYLDVVDAGGAIVSGTGEWDCPWAGIIQSGAYLKPNSNYTLFLFSLPNAFYPTTVPVTLYSAEYFTDYTFGPAHLVGNPEPETLWMWLCGLGLIAGRRLLWKR